MTPPAYKFAIGVWSMARLVHRKPHDWVMPTYSVNSVLERALTTAAMTHNSVGASVIRILLEELVTIPFACRDDPGDEALVRGLAAEALRRLDEGLSPAGEYDSRVLQDAEVRFGSRRFVLVEAEGIFGALGNTMAIFDRERLARCVDELLWHLGVDESEFCDRFTARLFKEIPGAIVDARLRAGAEKLAGVLG